MELPHTIKQLLDDNLHLEEDLPKIGRFNSTKEYKWLPGYIVKINNGRVENAKILQDKINRLGLKKIKIPKKYIYGDYAICEKIIGNGWDDGQNAMTIPLLRELHRLLTEDRPKYYDMICGNWIITDDGFLYVIDTDNKCFPKNLKKELFYEASWFLLGDIITRNGGCYMNRVINHPWQIIVRSCYSKHSQYPKDVYTEISNLFDKDVTDINKSYDYYRNLACKILNCEWPDKISSGSAIKFNPNSKVIQLSIGLYLSSLNEEFKQNLIDNPHLIKDVLYKVHAQGHDECFFGSTIVPHVTNYEIEDFQHYLNIAINS